MKLPFRVIWPEDATGAGRRSRRWRVLSPIVSASQMEEQQETSRGIPRLRASDISDVLHEEIATGNSGDRSPDPASPRRTTRSSRKSAPKRALGQATRGGGIHEEPIDIRDRGLRNTERNSPGFQAADRTASLSDQLSCRFTSPDGIAFDIDYASLVVVFSPSGEWNYFQSGYGHRAGSGFALEFTDGEPAVIRLQKRQK